MLEDAARRAAQAGALPTLPDPLPAFEVEPPRDPRHGDYAANIALVLAPILGRPPRTVGDAIVRNLRAPADVLQGATIAGPGFLNLRLAPAFVHR